MSTKIDLDAAAAHFAHCDPTMSTLLNISRTGPESITIPKSKPAEQYFHSLVASIIGQQISTKAASAVRGRVEQLLDTVTPENVLHTPRASLKQCGLSEQKVRYITENAAVWETLPYRQFSTMSDEEIIAVLAQLYGIGRWTAEMFLLFSLARPDVFSYGDFGLRQSLYRHYRYYPHYRRKIEATVTAWSPHRSVASLCLWHTLNNSPVLP